MKKAKASYVGNVRISCDSPVSNRAELLVGDVLIPFYELTVTLKAGELASITARIPVDEVDLIALQESTQIELVDREIDGKPSAIPDTVDPELFSDKRLKRKYGRSNTEPEATDSV